jgi:hypothetical protein
MEQDGQLDDIEILGGDPSTYLPDGDPYPLPQLITEEELRELLGLEDDTATAVATVRDDRAQLIANLGMDKLPHFLVNQEGVELCGSDLEPWPCTAWTMEVNPAAITESAGVPQEEKPYTAAEVAMAEEMGIPVAELRGRLGTR